MDDNKRVAHAVMETFLILNGKEIQSSVSEQEQLMLGVAAGTVSREQLLEWPLSSSVDAN
jgi:death on curing protein